MRKHTPGPWKVDEWSVYSTSAKSEDGKSHSYFTVAKCAATCGSLIHRSIARDEVDANTRLIAAAPEMLEALKRVIDDMRCACEPGDGPPEDCGICYAKHAIAKAEGKS